jgi:hypothetical protein
VRTIRKAICGALLLLLALAGLAAADSSVGIVPGFASVAKNGQVTFTGGGFAAGSVVDLTVNGTPRGTTRATRAGAFTALVDFPGYGTDSLAASGNGPRGTVHVVTAVATIEAPEQPDVFKGAWPVYAALGSGLASIAVAVLLLLGFRLLRRVPAAR